MVALNTALAFRTARPIAGAVLGIGLFMAVSPATGEAEIVLDWYASSDGNQSYDLLADSDVGYDENGLLQMLGDDEGSAQDWGLLWDVRTSYGGLNRGSGYEIVTADLAVTNNTLSPQVYWALVTVNGLNLGPATLTEGRVSGSINDLTNGEAYFSNPTFGTYAGDPVYQAMIDGSPVESMWDDFNLTVTGPPGAATGSDSTTFGDPVLQPAGAVGDSISVWLKVEVSPLDSVNIIGTFEVYAVPAPAALPVLAFFAVAGGRNRRRRA